MLKNYPVKIISDNPEENSAMFGFEAYAKTIAGLISNRENETPLVIGIYGSWGSGKTSLMKSVIRELKEDEYKDASRFRTTRTVWFQAWKYNDEDAILAALIEEIFKTMNRAGFFQSCRAEIEKLVKSCAPSKLITAISNLFGNGIDISEVFKDLEYKQKLGFYDTFQDFFDRLVWSFLNWRPQTTSCEQPDDKTGALVIFIDDLDRCPNDRIVKVLETIKLFMDKPGCVFVIGAANEIIEKALAEKYGEQDAGRFMDKIVQVTFHLPKIQDDDFKSYLQVISPKIHEEVLPHLPLIIQAMKYNPRQFKRFLNNLSLETGICKNKGLNLDFSRLLHWNIITYIYPNLHHDLKDNPQIFPMLKKYIGVIDQQLADQGLEAITDASLESVPRSLHEYLKDNRLCRIINSFSGNVNDIIQLVSLSGIVGPVEDVKAEKLPRADAGFDGMVKILAGKFLYGEKKEEKQISRAYEIDIYPVTNDQYERFMQQGGYTTDVFWSPEGLAWRNKNNIEEPGYWNDEKWNKPGHPVVGVSFYEAEAYANWAGKELPDELQWERAARGTDGREYPWGDSADKEKCNTEESGIGTTTKVTRYPNGVSPDGCYDMAGNVWEWTLSTDRNGRALRGGSWFNGSNNARCAFRYFFHPNSRSLLVGFRCSRTLK